MTVTTHVPEALRGFDYSVLVFKAAKLGNTIWFSPNPASLVRPTWCVRDSVEAGGKTFRVNGSSNNVKISNERWSLTFFVEPFLQPNARVTRFSGDLHECLSDLILLRLALE